MGKKEKITYPKIIQTQELFTNQECPLCKSYMTITKATAEFQIIFKMKCLNKDCNYEGERTLI